MLVDEDPGRSAVLERALQDNGYDVVARIGTDENVLDRVRHHRERGRKKVGAKAGVTQCRE